MPINKNEATITDEGGGTDWIKLITSYTLKVYWGVDEDSTISFAEEKLIIVVGGDVIIWWLIEGIMGLPSQVINVNRLTLTRSSTPL